MPSLLPWRINHPGCPWQTSPALLKSFPSTQTSGVFSVSSGRAHTTLLSVWPLEAKTARKYSTIYLKHSAASWQTSTNSLMSSTSLMTFSLLHHHLQPHQTVLTLWPSHSTNSKFPCLRENGRPQPFLGIPGHHPRLRFTPRIPAFEKIHQIALLISNFFLAHTCT